MSETVKRYALQECSGESGRCWAEMLVAPNGDYVAYADYAALAQRLADVAYLAEWQRAAPLTREIMCRADGAYNAMEATGGPTDAYRIVACAADLPALGARLRQREVGR